MTSFSVSARRACAFAFALLAGVGIAGCAGPMIVAEAPPLPAPAMPAVPVVAEAPPAASPAIDLADLLPEGPALIRSRLDPADDAAHVDLWARVRGSYAMPELDGDMVRKWEQWYATRPDYVQRMTERGGRYLFHIVEEIQRRGMPVDLALLPFVESAFNPQAQSTARAAGMWQFMPLTGKDFELKQNLFRDDRRDVLASTRAALDYLQRLKDQFGDWHLALAAYNWGQGNVQRAIARNLQAGLPADYLNLRLPDETRNYIPKLQAVKNIVARPADFGLVLPALDNHPFFLSVQIDRDIDVAVAALLAGLSLEEFQQINPQMNKPVILAAGTPQVLLPYDNANRFLRQIELYRGPLASWTAWVAPRTLKPADAARLAGVSEALLREVNKIPARMLVTQGSTLLVPRSAHATRDVAEHIADNAMMRLAPEPVALRKVVFKAGKKGEAVAEVARRYRVSPALVAQWNGLGPQASFKPGQTIVVMLAPAPKRTAARPAATSPSPKRVAKPALPARVRVAERNGSPG